MTPTKAVKELVACLSAGVVKFESCSRFSRVDDIVIVSTDDPTVTAVTVEGLRVETGIRISLVAEEVNEVAILYRQSVVSRSMHAIAPFFEFDTSSYKQ